MNFETFDLVGKTLFQAGLNSSHSGNISIYDRKQDLIYIKRSGAMLHALKNSDIVTVDINTLAGSELASSELPTHITIYKNTKANAIVHCHPPLAVGMSIAKTECRISLEFGPYGGARKFTNLPLEDVESKFHLKYVPITKEISYGNDLAKVLHNYFKEDINTVVAKGHGTFSIGDTLEECLHYATTLEQACKIYKAKELFSGN